MKKLIIILIFLIPSIAFSQYRTKIDTSRPTVTDDINHGSFVGMYWLKTTSVSAETSSGDSLFICKDDAVGAAVWQFVTTMDGGGGGGTTDTIFAKYVTTAVDTASAWKGNTDTLLIPVSGGLPSSVDGQMTYWDDVNGWDTIPSAYMYWNDATNRFFIPNGYINFHHANQYIGAGATNTMRISYRSQLNIEDDGVAKIYMNINGFNPAVNKSINLGKSGSLWNQLYTEIAWINDGSSYGTGTGITFGLGNSEAYESADDKLVINSDSITLQDYVNIADASASTSTVVLNVDNSVNIDGNLTVGGEVYGSLITKSYSFTSQGVGAGTYFKGGFYSVSATDANLTQASTTQTYGTANVAYSAHAFVVCGGAGTVDAGVVGLRVTGTSITDAGVRTASDADTIITDITAVATDEYYEGKKFIGTITYELITMSGTPKTYSLDFNYGYAKYEDFANHDFTVKGLEAVGLAGAADASFNIKLYKHCATGWKYSAAAFSASPTTICDLQTDLSTESDLANGIPFVYKRTPLSTDVSGSASEGVVVQITTSANNSVQTMDIHIGVKFKE